MLSTQTAPSNQLQGDTYLRVKDLPEQKLIQHAKDGNYCEFVDLHLQTNLNLDYHVQDGNTIICAAAENGHVDIVKYCIDHGVSPNHQTIEGCTPIMLAGMNGWYKVVELLQIYGADPSLEDQWGRSYNNYKTFFY